ncbi:hypothetical protein OIU84_008417 [Salix udensis]|uniref:Uncharacterized protein n=1 Tax=Salix udensis TaxID=889485 RepID=A0AAD6JPE9_9ROSI|nr:hypothetical protein OIU84_008417 [Salix udensis]
MVRQRLSVVVEKHICSLPIHSPALPSKIRKGRPVVLCRITRRQVSKHQHGIHLHLHLHLKLVPMHRAFGFGKREKGTSKVQVQMQTKATWWGSVGDIAPPRPCLPSPMSFLPLGSDHEYAKKDL